MGKNKNKSRQGTTQEQSENPPPEQSNDGNIAEDQNKNTQNNPQGVIVLGVHMHCQGCSHTVVKHLRGFDGVEEIETDLENNKVTVKGKKADPEKVFERLRKKINKQVTLISPILKQKKKDENKEDKKQEAKAIEVVLKILMHCQGCEDEIKHHIHKMKGVQTVEPDMKTSLVSVKGVFEPKKLIEYIHKRTGKQVVIVKQPQQQQQQQERKEEDKKGNANNKGEKKVKEEGMIDLKDYYQMDPPGLVYAPQFFSDENPNACSLM